MMEPSDFPQIAFKSHQLCFLNRDCREVSERKLETVEDSIIFSLNEPAIQKGVKKCPQEREPPEFHHALSLGQNNRFCKTLSKYVKVQNHFPRKNICCLSRNNTPNLTKGCFHAFVRRDLIPQKPAILSTTIKAFKNGCE
jgi:hypothetical protein